MPLSIKRKEELIEMDRRALSEVQDLLKKDPRPFEIEEIARDLRLPEEAVRLAVSSLRKNLTITGNGVALLKDKGKEYFYWKRKSD